MRKIVTALIAAACIAATAMASSNTARARWGGGGWYPGLGIAAGVAAGAILGGVLAAPYGYDGYPYGYSVVPGYGYGNAAYYGGYGGGGCYLVQQWGPYGPYMARVCY